MAIDSKQETLITLTEAAKLLPSVNGKRINTCTLWRWCRKGLRGVNLEYLRVGTKIVTSQDAMQRFFTELFSRDQLRDTRNLDIKVPKNNRIKKERRQKALEEANAILQRAGI